MLLSRLVKYNALFQSVITIFLRRTEGSYFNDGINKGMWPLTKGNVNQVRGTDDFCTVLYTFVSFHLFFSHTVSVQRTWYFEHFEAATSYLFVSTFSGFTYLGIYETFEDILDVSSFVLSVLNWVQLRRLNFHALFESFEDTLDVLFIVLNSLNETSHKNNYKMCLISKCYYDLFEDNWGVLFLWWYLWDFWVRWPQILIMNI